MALDAGLARSAGGRRHAHRAVLDAAVNPIAQARCALRPDPLATQALPDAGGPRRDEVAAHSALPQRGQPTSASNKGNAGTREEAEPE
eukprot:6222963-Heterocapsa_arctica.AAC.1